MYVWLRGVGAHVCGREAMSSFMLHARCCCCGSVVKGACWCCQVVLLLPFLCPAHTTSLGALTWQLGLVLLQVRRKQALALLQQQQQ